MTTDTENALQRAIEYLGAVEVAPERYAWQPNGDEWRVWRVVDENTLLDLASWVGLDPFRCGAVMPPWWSPETQYVWTVSMKSSHEEGVTISRYYGNEDLAQVAFDRWGFALPPQRITADLNTGEETPC